MQPDVEPYRRVERAVLIQAQPRKFFIKNLAVLFTEVTILDAPVGNGTGHSVDQLPDRSLALWHTLLTKKIFRDHHLGRELRPALGHLDIFLLENNVAAFVGNLRHAPVPLDLVEGIALGIAEHPLDPDARSFFALGQAAPFWGGDFGGGGASRYAGGGCGQRFVCVYHGLSSVFRCSGTDNLASGRFFP